MKHLVIFLGTIIAFSCAFVNKNNNVKNENFYLNDTSFTKIMEINQKWFNSWQWEKNTLKINDFQLIIDKSLNVEWENFDLENAYFRQFDTLLIPLNEYYIDLYSYNTLIEKDNDGAFVAFDVDEKVYVIDKQNKKRCEIAFAGSIENIEDAVFFDDNIIILFGYYYAENQENIPFLWLINIKNKHKCIYKYQHSFDDTRSVYFFTKFPNFKLME
jgi:hypothetical protein